MSPETREKIYQLAKSQYKEGTRLLAADKIEQAMSEFDQAQENFEALQNIHWLNFILREKLNCLEFSDNQVKIKEILNKMGTGYLETDDNEELSQTLFQLADLSHKNRDYLKSIDHLRIAFYLSRSDQKILLEGKVQFKMAQNMVCLEEYPEALEYLHTASTLFKQEQKIQDYLLCLRLEGHCYEKIYQFQEAEKRYSLAQSVNPSLNK